MNLPPILSGYLIPYSNLKNLCHLTGLVFGRIWRVVSQMPQQLYQLILSIKVVGERCFCSHSHSANQSLEEIPLSHSKPVCPRLRRFRKQDESLNSIDYHLHGICKSPEHLEDSLNNLKEDIENIISSPNINHDPLDKMGAVPLFGPKLNSIALLNSEALSQQNVENEILLFIQEMIQPAQDLLNEIENIENVNWQDILALLEKLEKERDPLKAYASKFEKIPQGHCLVQDTMKALEDKAGALEKELCAQIKRQYKVNYSIKKDGHCLFWSIEDLLKKNEAPIYYRKLAADYIRTHHQNFASGVIDAAKSKQGNAKINEYAKAQGGRQAWFDKLEIKLGRRPSNVDLYCDCLENSNLWGGVNEVLALSEQLEVPILIFSRQDNKSWRFDMEKGLSKFKNKAPLLLYYNGVNHYQSLIPVRNR